MSTRSIVGEIDEHDNFRGRYVHWDGSPDTRGPVLAELIAKFDGGLDRLLTVMIDENFGWSQLRPGKEDLDIGIAYDDEPDEWRVGVVGQCGDVEEWGYFFTSRDCATAELVVVKGVIEEGNKPIEVARVKVTELHMLTEDDWLDIEVADLPR